MSKIDINGDGKADFTISPMQIITVLTLFVSIIGSYYTLNARVDAVEVQTKKLKENEQKYTWPNQRKTEEQSGHLKKERGSKIYLKNLMVTS